MKLLVLFLLLLTSLKALDCDSTVIMKEIISSYDKNFIKNLDEKGVTVENYLEEYVCPGVAADVSSKFVNAKVNLIEFYENCKSKHEAWFRFGLILYTKTAKTPENYTFSQLTVECAGKEVFHANKKIFGQFLIRQHVRYYLREVNEAARKKVQACF